MQKLNRFMLEKSYNDIEINMIKEKLDKNSYMYDYILMNTSDIPSVVKEDVKNKKFSKYLQENYPESSLMFYFLAENPVYFLKS